jgi:hypothetical protein
MYTIFVWLTLLSNLFLINDHIVSLMYRKKVMTTSLAILAIVTAVSLVTASSGSGLVTSAFAVKKGASATTTGTSSSKKDTSGTSGTSTGSKSKFIKCVTAISGSLSRADVDNCWNQVFGSGGSSSALTLGASTSSGSSSSSSSGHSSGHGGTSNGGSSA